MGILGSTFGRALAGGGAAGAAIANKYLDEDIAKNRAQALADIQRTNAGLIRQDDLNFKTDPGNLAKSNDAARTTALAAGDTATEVDTRRLTNPGLLNAARAKKAEDESASAAAARKAKIEGVGDADYQASLGAESDAETGRKVKQNKVIDGAKTDEDIRRATAMLPLEVKKAYAVADAAGRAGARNREAPGADLQAKIGIMERSLGRPLAEVEKLGLFGLLKGRDPELDTETIKTTDPATGAETTRKQVRRPGAGGQADSVDEIKASMDAARAARAARDGKAGNPGAGKIEPTRKDPLSGQSLSERAWDKKFGRGDFKKDNGDGLPSMRPF